MGKRQKRGSQELLLLWVLGFFFFSLICKYKKALFSAKRIPSPDGRDLPGKVLIHVTVCHLGEYVRNDPQRTMLGSIP